ncbi:hypothetical protein BDN71DRAFT_1593626 [Pleurotus eryngii]|uniref:C2H2-type domain-containing protein n=1 Tax=Pleurotus eryngii TaxID=5323 RepID=A0A9P5ZKJ0_PLEER|nr:hypothetical protein BDN71DRAFT_1593626 [Pleurotus eryngii]
MDGTSFIPCNDSESEGHRELGQYNDPSQQWTTDWPYSSSSFHNFNPYPLSFGVLETPSVFTAFNASLPSVFSSNPVFQTVYDHSTTPYHASLRSVAQPAVNEWRAPLVNSGLLSTTLSPPVWDTWPSQQAPSFVREDYNVPQPEHILPSDNSIVRPQIATAATKRAAAKRRLHHLKHICKVCGSGFTSKPNRDRHVRAHYGERPFACECGMAFTSKNDLKRHRRCPGHRDPNTLDNSKGHLAPRTMVKMATLATPFSYKAARWALERVDPTIPPKHILIQTHNNTKKTLSNMYSISGASSGHIMTIIGLKLEATGVPKSTCIHLQEPTGPPVKIDDCEDPTCPNSTTFDGKQQ